MKKIFLLLIISLQFAASFAQSPTGEDENHIFYNTTWGAWQTAPGHSNISFSARLKYYVKKTQLYGWDIRMKSTRTPIYFEFKITNQVLENYERAVKENDGFYKATIFDSKTNTNGINGSGLGIYTASKTKLFFLVRNICYDFTERRPDCDVKKPALKGISNQSIAKQNKNAPVTKSFSVEELEDIILSNLKQHLKIGSFYNNIDNYAAGYDQISAARNAMEWSNEVKPHTLYILYHMLPASSYLFDGEFANLDVDKRISREQPLLYFKREMDYNHGNYDYTPALFLYDFGDNDENFIELKNAINALKNPQIKYVGESEHSGNTPNNIAANYPNVAKAASSEVEKDTDEGYRNAAKLLEPYAGFMDGSKLNSLGFYFWKVKDYQPALKYYKMSADKGNDWGYNNLRICYQSGYGVEVNAANYRKAFEYGSKVSSNFELIGETYHQLGHLCEIGANNSEGTPDFNTAANYFMMGANSKDASSMLHLGQYYDTGGRFPTNMTIAKNWYEKACELNNKDACEKLKKLQ
jgi:hypothetical protein